MIQIAMKDIMVRTVLRSAVAIVKTDIATMLTDDVHMDAWMGGKHRCVTKVISSFIYFVCVCVTYFSVRFF
jgi:hypothetical protein